jgi:hypothetical protein
MTAFVHCRQFFRPPVRAMESKSYRELAVNHSHVCSYDQSSQRRFWRDAHIHLCDVTSKMHPHRLLSLLYVSNV